MNQQQMKARAREVAAEKGLINLTRAGLCADAGIPDGSFGAVMGCSFAELVAELMREGLAVGEPGVSLRRAQPEVRRESILNAAIVAAQAKGYAKVTRAEVAQLAGVSTSLVQRYFSTMDQLRRAIIRRAIKLECVEILAQGLAARDPHAQKAPEALRRAAAESLLTV